MKFFMILLIIITIMVALITGNALTNNNSAEITKDNMPNANIKIKISDTEGENQSSEKTEKFI